MLKSIRISNFKGISDAPVELGKFNVLIGANAAGKTNFVDALRFIHDILEDGLSSAIGRRLGWENVLTREKGKTERITAEILCDLPGMDDEVKIGRETDKAINLKYKFEIGCSMKRLYVANEVLKYKPEENKTENKEGFERSRRKVQISRSRPFKERTISVHIPRQAQNKLFLEAEFFSRASSFLSSFIHHWRFYELDVGTARCPSTDLSYNILLSDGSNLASILDKLKETKSSRLVRNQILETMANLIPGFRDWKTARQFDGSLGFKIRERGISKAFLPKMISDGTIRLLSVLLALLYGSSEASLICIDEPERYLHPQILEQLVEIMRNVSEKTQLIVTTQSAELVKWLKPNEVLMVDKKNNITHVKRAENIEMVDKFIEEFTMDELWLGGYLEGGRIL